MRNAATAEGGRRLRLDQLLVDRGLAESRARARALIMAGLVFSGDRRFDKPGMLIGDDAELVVKGRDHPWVSRGGVKLAHALDQFDIDPAGSVCLDVGASTGGFTNVLLTRHAARVYAVDVGRGQLAWKLRVDPRVVLLERVNARHLTRDLIPEAIDLIVCDVSFISLTLALPPALALAGPGARLIALIKPQFEAGRAEVGKGGIVRDADARLRVSERISTWLSAQPGWQVLGVIDSPITGTDGNREYLIGGLRGSD